MSAVHPVLSRCRPRLGLAAVALALCGSLSACANSGSSRVASASELEASSATAATEVAQSPQAAPELVAAPVVVAAAPAPRAADPERAKEASLRSDLATLRQGLALYAEQHRGQHPEDPASQLLVSTDARGQPGREFGPYLRNEWPANPFTGVSSIRFVRAMPEVPGHSGGWVYCPSTGELRVDMTGRGPSGKRLYEH